MISAQSSLIDVCFAACSALDDVGTRAVLSGGSAATFYSPQRYQSYDADFILTFGGGLEAHKALLEIGYSLQNGMYIHAENKFTLEFPPGPLSIGDEIITDYQHERRDSQILYIIDRTDCIRDRLSAFYFWNDRSSLVTAIAVAESGDYDLQRIMEWSKKNGMIQRYEEFINELKK